ncbi:hypothetical protein E2C01_060813 [Portunus trituberculatus]|uniref:Uncharacterized protein n=1 Tax=Portunus trituberculatus TaxID=210409 RepID=A0A5B7H6J2_PORTR|nr:hypothetical protein [Portunus trituberculatus]
MWSRRQNPLIWYDKEARGVFNRAARPPDTAPSPTVPHTRSPARRNHMIMPIIRRGYLANQTPAAHQRGRRHAPAGNIILNREEESSAPQYMMVMRMLMVVVVVEGNSNLFLLPSLSPKSHFFTPPTAEAPPLSLLLSLGPSLPPRRARTIMPSI